MTNNMASSSLGENVILTKIYLPQVQDHTYQCCWCNTSCAAPVPVWQREMWDEHGGNSGVGALLTLSVTFSLRLHKAMLFVMAEACLILQKYFVHAIFTGGYFI